MNGGKLLGKGTIGQVFTIKNKDNNIIKISKTHTKNKLIKEYELFKKIIEIFPKEFIERFFIISNESINNKNNIIKLLNNNDLKKLNFNIYSNDSEVFSFILKKGIQYNNYKNINLNLDNFYFKIFYKLLICYNICLNYNVANFDSKPSNTIIKKINDVHEIISIDYDNIYFIKNKNDLIKFKVLAPGYTYYWPPEFWKYKKNSDIPGYLNYYFPSKNWKDTYIELNKYIKNGNHKELISKGMVWHLVHSFFFTSYHRCIILKENIFNSKHPFLKYDKIKELFAKALEPDPKKRISSIELIYELELIAKDGTFGKEIQSYFTSKEINLSQIFGLDYKKPHKNDVILKNDNNQPVFQSIIKYYILKNNNNQNNNQNNNENKNKNKNNNNNNNNNNKTNKNKQNNKKDKIKISVGGKLSNSKIRKHKGICQIGKKAGQLNPGYKYSGELTKSGLKVIIKI